MQRYLKLLIKKVFLFIGVLVVSSTNWFITTFDELSLDEIIFHLKVPMTGSNSDFLLSYIKGPLLNSLLIFLLITSFYYIILRFLKYFEIKFTAKKLLTTIAITILLLYSFNYSYQALGFQDYIKNNLVTSTIYEEHYVKPSEDLITFPKNKRNLVYIFVESYESTFTSKDLGGALSFNTLDKIADLAKEYDHFSNTDKLGGAAAASGTSWTVAGMVAQTSGINLRLPINGNSYGQFEHFLPGAISIGDLLEKAGYNQTLFIGSDADFGGRKSFFTQHGNYTIKDYNYAIDQKLIPEDYLEWWGYEDEKLYEFAKDELLNLANLDQPFNFTMLTADTHHVDGYLTDGAKTPYEEQYKNVILNSSQQLYEFITWIQAQDFYENTTIVIAGDHHTMDAGFIERNVDKDYERRIFNLIINSIVKPNNTINRDFASFDLFPTTLASMGIEIKGDRLGLGTNLYSNKETIFEEFGINYVNSELDKKSRFYSNTIIHGK